jgi:hypothetical protein
MPKDKSASANAVLTMPSSERLIIIPMDGIYPYKSIGVDLYVK